MRRSLLLSSLSLMMLATPALAQQGQGELESQNRPSLLRPDSLIGREVLSEDGSVIGTVDDVVTADASEPKTLIVEGGGTGMDGKRIAVDYGFEDLDVRGDWVVTRNVTGQEIAALPSVSGDGEAVSLRSRR